jgi:DNA-binding transcriptional ArsR family regulator
LTRIVNRHPDPGRREQDGAMSVTIDVRGLEAGDFVFGPSPLAELASAAHLLVEPVHHPAQRSWIEATSGVVEPQLLERLIDADFLWRTSRADMLLPAVPGRSLGEELDTVDALDDETWVSAALLTSSCGTVPLYAELGSPLTDDAARALALERAAARGPRQAAFVDVVLDDPARARTLTRTLLEDCDAAFFADTWSRVRPSIAADARLKADTLALSGLSGALDAISPAVTFDDAAGRISIDKLQNSATTAAGRGVTFLPSVFGHPHLLVVHAPAWQPVVQYPIPLGSAEPETVTIDAVQERLHALDNPIRLRLARSLIRAPRTTADLAEAWQLSAAEVSRHLAELKRAGFVTDTRRGRYVVHEFDTAAAARIGLHLVEALLR